MHIDLVVEQKENLMPLLLLGDESLELIAGYLDRGELYALYDPDLRGVCVVTDEGQGVFEIQNLAIAQEHQGKGYGQAIVSHIRRSLSGKAHILMVGTGDSPRTLGFYQRCGFVITSRIKDYMLTHYQHPILEDGVQIVDKVYLSMKL